jgi:hypothetical protein
VSTFPGVSPTSLLKEARFAPWVGVSAWAGGVYLHCSRCAREKVVPVSLSRDANTPLYAVLDDFRRFLGEHRDCASVPGSGA